MHSINKIKVHYICSSTCSCLYSIHKLNLKNTFLVYTNLKYEIKAHFTSERIEES